MKSPVSAVVVAVFSSLISACNCAPPCTDARDCAPGETCVANLCRGPAGTGGSSAGSGGSGGAGGNGGAGGGGPCMGLQCQQMPCTPGSLTTLTGSVFTPKGDLPLFNAIVYVPNTPVLAFTPGVSCDQCGAGISGNPVVQTLTRSDGTFRLENVPAGANIPLVIQMGRWRRQVTLTSVPACQTTPLAADLTRLPRNKSEGDIPQMAIATGNSDPFECLLRKVGLDDAEITVPSGTGRVHYYHLNGIDLSPPSPVGAELYGTLDNLKKYDVVMLPCEGSEIRKSAAHTQNIIDYANLGGRLFATHFSYVWVEHAQAPFPGTATWRNNTNNPSPLTYTLDTSFPKGNSFADWLQNVNATTTRAQLPIIESRRNVVSINSAVAQRWFYATAQGAATVGHYTFNTPVAALLPDGGAPAQCGRVVFSDFHVSAAALSGQPNFPASCKNEPPSAQEKALIFMLFDLSSCVQRDEIPPIN